MRRIHVVLIFVMIMVLHGQCKQSKQRHQIVHCHDVFDDRVSITALVPEIDTMDFW